MFSSQLTHPLCALLLAGLIAIPSALDAQGPPSASNADAPAAVALTFPPHTHLMVNAGRSMIVLYRSGSACPLEIRHDPGVPMAAISSKDDPRGLTVNGGDMIGNVGPTPCRLGVLFYKQAGPPGSGLYSTITKNG